MSFKNKICHKGFTLIEILIVTFLLIISMAVTYSAFAGVKSSYNIMESRVSARQELIKATNLIHNDVRNAAYVYAGREVTMDTVDYTLNGIDEKSKSLILAIPEKQDLEDETYTVVAYYLADSSGDPVNIATKNLVRYEKTAVKPQITNTPASIRLEDVASGNRKIAARYIDPDRFSFTVRENGASVDINPVAVRREIWGQKPVVVEVFSSVNLRNK